MNATKQKATLPKNPVENAKNYSNKKETTDTRHLIAVRGGKAIRVATLICWMGRSGSASTVYGPDYYYTTGAGQAGGHGYHKASAAADSAIESAGIKLANRIDGVGDPAMDEALLAIGRALGYRGHMIVV